MDEVRRRKCLAVAVQLVYLCLQHTNIRVNDVFQIGNKPFKKLIFADLPHQIGGGLLTVILVIPSNWTAAFRSCYLTIMEQAFQLFLSHEIAVCVSALVIAPEWSRPSRSFISRDCSMRLCTCYLTRMERA